MKQVVQNLRTGLTELMEVPYPAVTSGHVLVRSARTLISVGTERMLVDFSQASLLGKARSQPDKVKQVLEKMRTDGVVPAIVAALNKLDQPLALGYCNVGTVLELGLGVKGLAVGDRVVSNGKHAEVVRVPQTLCCQVPAGLADDEAVFTVIGAIALQGMRLAKPDLGESVAVIGLGLIGLMTVQLLQAQGCRVLGIDFDERKLSLARQFGAEVVNPALGADPVAAAYAFSRGRGVDAVLITASTTSSDPVHIAAKMCRKRGRLVLVGVTGLELSRADFYEKELSFQVSCSYGPGRHDTSYEEAGVDYPVGFVRWTAQRNFEAVLDMIAERRIDVRPLISHRFAVADMEHAYGLLRGDADPLGIVLEYSRTDQKDEDLVRRRTIELTKPSVASLAAPRTSLGFIGAGNYATAVLIPAFKATGARLRTVVSNGGVSGIHAARKFGFEAASTDSAVVYQDPAIETVVIATRHDSHARFVRLALDNGKHVFVEKPLALSLEDLRSIEESCRRATTPSGRKPTLMVGFNRRFAPHVVKIRELLASVKGPKVFVMTVNAGALAHDHWAYDPTVGGGRIASEACHFIDLMRFLAGESITGCSATSMGAATRHAAASDNSIVTLRFEDDSIGTILYLANGHKSFPKERLEVFAGGRILQLDNFRKLTGYGWPGFTPMRLWRQDKGQKACAAAFIQAVEHGGNAPIPLDELLEVGRVTIQIAEMVR